MARILIIDDNTDFRVMLRVMLESAGYAVLEAANGVEGIQAYRKQRPDLVLCDIIMPDKEGLETIREMRREFQGVVIIAMTGGFRDGSLNPLTLAERFGAVRSLWKPFDLETLLLAVQESLRTRPGESDVAFLQ